MLMRPDAGDEIQFPDEPEDHPGEVVATGHPTSKPPPSLAEQRARRRHRRGLGGDIRKGVA